MRRFSYLLLTLNVPIGAVLSNARAQGVSRDTTAVASMYQALCASCHGRTLDGGTGPSLVDQTWLYGSDDDNVARLVRNGMPAKGMPAWGGVLSDAEIRTLVIFLRERRSEHEGKRIGRRNHDSTRWRAPEGPIETQRHAVRIETVVDGLDAPYAFAFLPNGQILVSEKHAGLLRIVTNGVLAAAPVKGIPESHRDPEGFKTLLDVTPHPNYATNGWIYLSYGERCTSCDLADSTKGELPAVTTIVRGRIEDGAWTGQQTIWRAPALFYVRPSDYYAGRMVFDDNGYLFFSVGVNDDIKEQAQDKTRPKGKIHRVFDDGRVPPDNPFIKEQGAFPTIWSYGHRNPQGLAIDRRSGQLWSSEHGPRGGDELNVVLPGRNYGWPVVTAGMNYDGTPVSDKTSQPGMEHPVAAWTPAPAVSSITFYEGNAFPNWRHHLFVTTLKQEELIRIETNGSRVVSQEVILKDIGRLRDIETGPDGNLYLLVEIRSTTPRQSRIVRLVPAGMKKVSRRESRRDPLTHLARGLR